LSYSKTKKGGWNQEIWKGEIEKNPLNGMNKKRDPCSEIP
jgi:hypothetical protein